MASLVTQHKRFKLLLVGLCFKNFKKYFFWESYECLSNACCITHLKFSSYLNLNGGFEDKFWIHNSFIRSLWPIKFLLIRKLTQTLSSVCFMTWPLNHSWSYATATHFVFFRVLSIIVLKEEEVNMLVFANRCSMLPMHRSWLPIHPEIQGLIGQLKYYGMMDSILTSHVWNLAQCCWERDFCRLMMTFPMDKHKTGKWTGCTVGETVSGTRLSHFCYSKCWVGLVYEKINVNNILVICSKHFVLVQLNS